MDRRVFLATLACLPACALAADGDPVAELFSQTLPDLQGNPQRLADWRGQALVVNFWASWCLPCVREMPMLDRLQKAHPKVKFVGIGVDSSANMLKFLQKTPVSYEVLVMGMGGVGLLRKLGDEVGGLPFTLVFDANGGVKSKIIGQIKENDLDKALRDITVL